MTKLTDAVFENGMLRPVDDLQLSEGQTVRLVVMTADPSPPADSATADQTTALLSVIDSLPDVHLGDESDVVDDHDRYLYGDRSKFAYLWKQRPAP